MHTGLTLEENKAANAQMSPFEIFSLIQEDLVCVERELIKQADTSSATISAVVKHLIESGGKRVRPALLLLASRLVHDNLSYSAVRMGAVMEMLHSATLIHDDIIDEASVRRGRASANAQWGNNVTVLVGDWLYMTAFDTSLRERNFDILESLTEMTRLMVEGEILQLSLIGNSHITEAEHLEIVRRKTAYMFRACTEIGWRRPYQGIAARPAVGRGAGDRPVHLEGQWARRADRPGRPGRCRRWGAGGASGEGGCICLDDATA